MKKIRLLLILGLALQAGVIVIGQTAPPTLPSKGPNILSKPARDVNGAETRKFHVGGKEYWAVLPHRDIISGPDWNPALPLPTTLNEVVKKPRSELDRLLTDSREWELASVEISKFSENAHVKWYYALTFDPVLKVPSLSSDSVVLLATLDGKLGHQAVYRGKQ